MSEYKARRSFYNSRLYTRGSLVDIEEAETIRQLLNRGLIAPVSAAGPSETQTIKPQETKQPAATQEPAEDIAALSYTELKKRAKEAGIKSYNSMKKEDLIQLLKGEI